AANIFVVNDNTLYTPPLKHVLGGITRRTVLDIAQKEKIPAFEKELTVVDLYDADEAFLTSTGMDIVAIIEVDGRIIGDGTPGHMLQRLITLFEKKMMKESISLF
ncbi:aminotransferase class IV, partial [Chloroflexota bacterium]